MSDREALLELADALNCPRRALRRDECGDWRIKGKSGHIYAVPGGFQLCCMCEGALASTWAKKKMPFAHVTQDGDAEGVLRMSRLPTRTEADAIRSYLVIPKRRVLSDVELARLRSIGFGAGVQGRFGVKKLALADCPAT
jgi:hypothetical protein